MEASQQQDQELRQQELQQHQQQQHPELPPLHQRRGPRRGLLKLALEASPFQHAQIPPCRLRSVAIVNPGDQDDQLLVYLGTDSGHLLLFTWVRSSPAALRSNGTTPDVARSDDREFSNPSFLLSRNRNLGKSSVDCLCPLPRGGVIAALVDQQVIVLDLHTLGPLDLLPFTKGALTLTRAFGSTESLQPLKGNLSALVGLPGREGIRSPEATKSSAGQGQLGRLFGSGRLSVKRGSWNLLVGEVGTPSSGGAFRGDVVDASSGASTTKRGVPGRPAVLNAKHSPIERFAVAIRQKLLMYEIRIENQRRKGKMWVGDSKESPSIVKVKEILGPEEVISMAWVGNVIITGNRQEYMLFSVMDGQASLLFSLPQDILSPPVLKAFPKELEFLLLIDMVGVGVNASGQPTSSSLLFRDIPDAIGQSSSYVVVVKRGLIELYHRKTGAKVQSLVLSDAAVGPYFITDDEDGKFMVVSSALKVYCLERVPVEDQLKELLRQRQIDEAVELAEECVAELEDGNAQERLAIVHAQAGYLLFFDLQFKDAVDHFLQSSVMLPTEIFPFFPNLTERWRTMVPRNRYWGLHPPPQAIHNVVEIKLHAMRRELILQSVSNMNDLPNGHSLSATSSKSKSAIIEDHVMQATEQVIRYLKVVRNQPTTALMKEGVDTLLMKLFIKVAATAEMEQLAASENSCVVEEVEDFLQASGKLRTLAFLYETKGLQTQALQVWQTLAQGNMTMPMMETIPVTKISETILTDRVEMSDFQLAAAREAARLLEASSDSKLVLSHLKWILKVSQDLALQILSSSKRLRALPPNDVLHGLGPSEAYVQQRYLQWLVQEQGVEDSSYHTLFALSLAKSAMATVVKTKGSRDIMPAGHGSPSKSWMTGDVKIGNSTIPQTKNGVYSSYPSNAVIDIKDSAGMQPQSDKPSVATASAPSEGCTLSDNVRQRLQKFLGSSEKYDPKVVLALIHGSELWREQAILHRKLGDEISVFKILALKLGDTDAAEQYCVELGRPDAFMRLLDLYLKPGEGREPMYSAAVHLLQLHGTSLDPLQVLEALSPDMPLQLAFETLSRMFRMRVHLYREGQIVKHLMRAENFEARVARLEERVRHTRITDQSSCGSCFARFGTKLFALYPTGSVVCYKCFRSSGGHVDPVTGRDFQKEPP